MRRGLHCYAVCMPDFGVCLSGWEQPTTNTQLAAVAAAGFKLVRCDVATLPIATARADTCYAHGLKLLTLVRDSSLLPLANHPGIAGFEVWNEPNLIQPLAMPAWVALISAVAKAGCVPTISGGVADNKDYAAWVKAVRPLPASVKLGVHPYVFGSSAVSQAHSLDKQRDIWVTEFGAGKEGLAEAKRAAYLKAELKAMMPLAKALIVYSWDDPDFSIASPDGSLLASGKAISSLIR